LASEFVTVKLLLAPDFRPGRVIFYFLADIAYVPI